MFNEYSLFSYQNGNSFLHKCPFWFKFFLSLMINILLFWTPFKFIVVLIFLQFGISCLLKFSIKEQFYDIRIIIYYGLLLYLFNLILWFGNGKGLEVNLKNFLIEFTWEKQKSTVLYLARILAVIQCCSLLFKTSTLLEMREGIAKFFGKKSVITITFFMFLNFLPMISKIWTQCKKSWFARGGKIGLKMYVVLLPVLLSVGLKKAYNVSRAFLARK